MKNEIQLKFVQRLKERLPGHSLLADEISDLLNISKDGAYRRIRGETTFSMDEAALLSMKFNIPGDSYGQAMPNQVTFSFNQMDGGADCLERYFQSLLADLQKLQGFERKKIWFAAEDIPLWHHFAYKELTAFKLFYWTNSVLNMPSLSGKVFDAEAVDPKLIETAFSIRHVYSVIPSAEIWTKDTINSLLNQVEFYWETGRFASKATSLVICTQMIQMLDDIEARASRGLKEPVKDGMDPAEFTLYYSELMMCNNCAVVEFGPSKAVYLSHYNFNSLITQNEDFCNEMQRWMRSRILTATLLSGSSEKDRSIFFNKQRKKVEELIAKIDQ